MPLIQWKHMQHAGSIGRCQNLQSAACCYYAVDGAVENTTLGIHEFAASGNTLKINNKTGVYRRWHTRSNTWNKILTDTEQLTPRHCQHMMRGLFRSYHKSSITTVLDPKNLSSAMLANESESALNSRYTCETMKCSSWHSRVNTRIMARPRS